MTDYKMTIGDQTGYQREPYPEKQPRSWPRSYGSHQVAAANRLYAPRFKVSRWWQAIEITDRNEQHMFYPRRRRVYSLEIKGYPVIMTYGRVRKH